MVKGDKGKFAKRGGRGSASSRFFANSAEEIEQRNNRIAEFDAVRSKRRSDDDDDDEDEEIEDDNGHGEEQEDHADGSRKADSSSTILTKKVETQMKQIKVKENDDDEEAEGKGEQEDGFIGGRGRNDEEIIRTMTRKERELADKEKAAAEYRRKHELGLTEEYKRDMAKLEEVRKRREAATQRALEDKEAKDSAEKEARDRAQKMGMFEEEDDDEEEIDEDDNKKTSDEKKKTSSNNKKSTQTVPKLDKIAIKKMKPTQLKEALKARNLDIQGNAKELTDRLLEYEATR